MFVRSPVVLGSALVQAAHSGGSLHCGGRLADEGPHIAHLSEGELALLLVARQYCGSKVVMVV